MASQWQGKSTARLRSPTPDQVWPLLEDFFALHKWHPSLDTCRRVEGGDGLLRYCSATLPPPPGTGSEEQGLVRWCHERLVDVDPVGKCLSYEMVDNNMGFKLYKATMRVSPPVIDGCDEPIGSGCMIEWSFLADPVEGWSYEDLVKYVEINLQGMAQNMEKALVGT